MVSFSNNASVAGQNVYVLGTTFDTTADRLVSYGLSRGLGNFAVVYPLGLEGESARDAVGARGQPARGGTLVSSQPYNVSVAGIQAAAGPAAAALSSAGANAIILTDGPTGGLAYIAEGLRNNGLGAGQAQFLGMQRWDVSAEALAVPALQGGVFAAPDPGLVAAFNGRYQHAYGESPHELAGLAYDGIAAVGALIAAGARRGRQPVLDRAADPARGLRRGERRVPAAAERAEPAQPRDRRGPGRPGGGGGARGEDVWTSWLLSSAGPRRTRPPGAACRRRRRPSSTSRRPAPRSRRPPRAARDRTAMRAGGGRGAAPAATPTAARAIAAAGRRQPARGAPRDPRLRLADRPGRDADPRLRARAGCIRCRTRPPRSASRRSPSAATAGPRWRRSPTSTCCSSPPTSRPPGARA